MTESKEDIQVRGVIFSPISPDRGSVTYRAEKVGDFDFTLIRYVTDGLFCWEAWVVIRHSTLVLNRGKGGTAEQAFSDLVDRVIPAHIAATKAEVQKLRMEADELEFECKGIALSRRQVLDLEVENG